MTMQIEKATSKQVRAVVTLMLDGVSSDPTSLNALKQSWWQRLLFQYLFGPRMFQRQMETAVATQTPGSTDLLGYISTQYTGETASTFDWGLAPAIQGTPQAKTVLAALLKDALDRAEAREAFPYFYFGLMSERAPEFIGVLEDEGMWLPDYQLVQMVGPLPAESPSMPEELQLTAQIPARFTARALELLRLDYIQPPDDDPAEFAGDLDMIAALHESTLRTAKLFLVEHEGQEVGLVQQNLWRDELRVLLALQPELWGSDLERQLVAALPGFLNITRGRLRLRTFSQKHLQASRASLESLGLSWEESPWQRWMVAL